MEIKFVELENFRKLKSCRISFSEKQTLLVGANNSGKTSAMDALISFLSDKTRFKTKDITLSNWGEINSIGKNWAEHSESEDPDLSIEQWHELLPKLDVWLNVNNNEIQHVSDLIPTLSWRGGLLGVRLILEPKDIEKFYKEFRARYLASQETKKSAKSKLKLWPSSMWDFLEKKGILSHFSVTAYLLNPQKIDKIEGGIAKLQKLENDSLPIESNPFEGLVKIDIINAQRGFSDPNDSQKNYGSLSNQLREYFSKHLNPTEIPNISDVEALDAIEEAKKIFDKSLKSSFESSLSELEELNYPGFGNPNISISSEVRPIDSLDHNSAVQFGLLNSDKENGDDPLSLPEIYNGLGYQNLISMVFKLIRFRDEWMKAGKVETQDFDSPEEIKYEPLHLVLIEEPEAHLHAQVQQVFVRKAYEVLRNNEKLRDKNGKDINNFKTQLIISTHSNHVAHEIDFNSLRYFKRILPEDKKVVPTSVVINLSDTFGKDDETTRFAIRYLKTTHCDLFFADAVILIEGPAERMLMPYFIEKHFPKLRSSYISLLEIGGSHAHRLKPLIENLGIITLVVTDLDSGKSEENAGRLKAIAPKKNDGQSTLNTTLKTWLPKLKDIDDLIELKSESKLSEDGKIRVAYQNIVEIEKPQKQTKNVIPYTFEDALVYQNIDIFKNLEGTGLIKKLKEALELDDVVECSEAMFEALREGKKAEFALELLFLQEPSELITPSYIEEGLQWIEESLDVGKYTLAKVIEESTNE